MLVYTMVVVQQTIVEVLVRLYNDFIFILNPNQLSLLQNTTHLSIQFGLLVFSLSIACLLAPNYFGLYGAFFVTLIPLLFTWLYSMLTMFFIYKEPTVIFLNGFKWFVLPGHVQVTFDLLIDKLSVTYTTLILSIGICVLVYAFSYFRYEPNVDRLFLLINLFMISMCILVLGGNTFVLFFGWELIGLTSFFLINFWSTKISTLKAAFKAFIFNKISDLGLLIFIILAFVVSGESNIPVLNSSFVTFLSYNITILGVCVSFLEALGFFLMISALIKSAQFGCHIWLPDSMEAPVPASSLIHSATLVSAGVFLLLRFSSLFEIIIVVKGLLLLISSFTAAFGAVCACYQSDTKKILAYSTISHCGFLIFLACFNNLDIVLLYLCVHGFFKAVVFMCVGNVIRFARNYQDFRFMGGFFKYLPFEAIMMFIGLINLAGLPFSFGFFIKHQLLVSMFDIKNLFIQVNLVLGMCAGMIYSYRLYYYVYFDTKKAKKAIYYSASKNGLKSKFYSNTTLASCLAITLLFTIAVCVISFLYISLFTREALHSSNAGSSYTNKTYFLLINPLKVVTNLSTYINWVIIILIGILLTIKFRYQAFYSVLLNKINSFVIFFFFFYFSLIMLSV